MIKIKMEVVIYDEDLLNEIFENIDEIKDIKSLRVVNKQFHLLLKSKFEELYIPKKTRVRYITDDDIYKCCYWGDFLFHFDLIKFIHNRNKFVKEHKIVRETIIPRYVNDEIQKTNLINDHTEYYITKDNYYLVITSPYIDKCSEEYECMVENGWVQTKKLYTYGAITFYKKMSIPNFKIYKFI
jgi:hypothetical protein